MKKETHIGHCRPSWTWNATAWVYKCKTMIGFDWVNFVSLFSHLQVWILGCHLVSNQLFFWPRIHFRFLKFDWVNFVSLISHLQMLIKVWILGCCLVPIPLFFGVESISAVFNFIGWTSCHFFHACFHTFPRVYVWLLPKISAILFHRVAMWGVAWTEIQIWCHI